MLKSNLHKLLLGFILGSWILGFSHLLLMGSKIQNHHCPQTTHTQAICQVMLTQLSNTSLDTIPKLSLYLFCALYVYICTSLTASKRPAYRYTQPRQRFSYLSLLFAQGILNPKAP